MQGMCGYTTMGSLPVDDPHMARAMVAALMSLAVDCTTAAMNFWWLGSYLMGVRQQRDM